LASLDYSMSDIIVVALESEVPELFKQYKNIHTIGVGKVNAAINTMRLINHYRPARIINIGTAGGVTVSSGIHRINTVWQHDVNLMPLGLQPGIHLSDPGSVLSISGAGKICGSGDLFVTEPTKLRIKCDIVEMEAYSVVKAAQAVGAEVEVWKYISDAADGTAPKTWAESVAAGEELYRKVFADLDIKLETR